MRYLLPAVIVTVFQALAGCASVPDSIVMQPTTARPQPMTAAPAANGAIFQSAAYRPLFEDRRARMVGDVITIAIVEKTAAGKQANSNGSKTGSANFALTKLFGAPASTTRDAGFGSNGAFKFEDKGGVNSTNNFTGTITVTVVDVMQNGNLVVSGEKQVALDKSTEYIRFSGVVSPDNIAAGNIVPSTQVADARVEYRTNTNIDKTEVMGALARFFLSVMPL
jgi:flagellar L-ring protein precursor FlgH